MASKQLNSMERLVGRLLVFTLVSTFVITLIGAIAIRFGIQFAVDNQGTLGAVFFCGVGLSLLLSSVCNFFLFGYFDVICIGRVSRSDKSATYWSMILLIFLIGVACIFLGIVLGVHLQHAMSKNAPSAADNVAPSPTAASRQ